ncbi:hypothetical protein RRF57_012538 [Xylaria bambusicola]|uniref:Uncharacterized protein n=1 Tax=Xylaria bambusicola TaxID=326684 RepID=A0AAN7V1V1_9PEZI
MTVLRKIVLKSIKQECSCLLNHALRLEYIDHTVKINQRTAFIASQCARKFCALFWVCTDDVLEQTDPIWLITSLGTIWQNLLKLAKLSIRSNNFVSNIGF